MSRAASIGLRAATLVVVLVAAIRSADAQSVALKDGRVVRGTAVEPAPSGVTVETAFGRIAVPQHAIAKRPADAKVTPERAASGWRTIETRWFTLRTDVSDARVRAYRDVIDPFGDRMRDAYAFPRGFVDRTPKCRFELYRSRADFKRRQARVAAGIERQRGRGFAEGIAGFYSPKLRAVICWDTGGAEGDADLEVARHEIVHYFNHCRSVIEGRENPSWFEEGTATYFSTPWVGPVRRSAPELHAPSLFLVHSDLAGDRPYGLAALLGRSYGEFLGREYAWGWALVRFLRTTRGGKVWPRVLKTLRGADATPSGVRRFLKAVRYPDVARFERAWYGAIRTWSSTGPAGAAATTLDMVRRSRRPSRDEARAFARVGCALARKRLHAAARVYLEAALRGGAASAAIHTAIARAMAGEADVADDDPWPDAAVNHLRDAVACAPLDASHRAELARRLVDAGAFAEAWRAFGLAIVLAGPDDDVVSFAAGALEAAAESTDESASGRRGENGGDPVARLRSAAPWATAAIERASVYHLQANQAWRELRTLLTKRHRDGRADAEERRMLADLHRLGESFDAAADLYRGLLDDDPRDLSRWLPYVTALRDAGRTEDARRARKRAIESIAAANEDWASLRRDLAELDL